MCQVTTIDLVGFLETFSPQLEYNSKRLMKAIFSLFSSRPISLRWDWLLGVSCELWWSQATHCTINFRTFCYCRHFSPFTLLTASECPSFYWPPSWDSAKSKVQLRKPWQELSDGACIFQVPQTIGPMMFLPCQNISSCEVLVWGRYKSNVSHKMTLVHTYRT